MDLSSFYDMEKIDILNEKIIVDSEYFDAKATLECGQVFRFYQNMGDGYTVISGDKKCNIKTVGNQTVITTAYTDYFYNYFDLERDYRHVFDTLSGFSELSGSIENGKGIHILKQQIFETVISFIISANNNIKRIKGIIERICAAYGQKIGDYYAFPLPYELKNATAEDFYKLGAGYRSAYLQDTIKVLNESDILERLVQADYQTAIKELLKLKGVGRKVADCIALFALNHTCCYPVDTWIYKADCSENQTKDEVRKNGMERYKDYAGFAQQIRFYNMIKK